MVKNSCVLMVVLAAMACTPLMETSRGAYAVSVQRALEFLPDGETMDWVDPETGETARVTVQNTTRAEDEAYCREIVFETLPAPADPDAPTDPDAAVEAAEPAAGAPAESTAEPPQTYCRDAETGDWLLKETARS